MIGTETVTVLHPSGGGGIGTDGEPIDLTYTQEDIGRCLVAPGLSSENTTFQDTALVAFTVYLPPGSVVEFNARMTVRGSTCEVVGVPEAWVGATGGVVAYLSRSDPSASSAGD